MKFYCTTTFSFNSTAFFLKLTPAWQQLVLGFYRLIVACSQTDGVKSEYKCQPGKTTHCTSSIHNLATPNRLLQLKQNNAKQFQNYKCGPMPNLMAALPNIGGALCSTPQSLADAHY